MSARWLVTAVLAITAASASATHFVSNGDFETGDLAGWATPFPPEFFRVTDEVARSGRYGLRASGNRAHPGNHEAFLVQSLKLVPTGGARYRLSGWTRGRKAASGGWAVLWVKELGSGGEMVRIERAEVRLDEAKWQPAACEFRGAEGAVGFQVGLSLVDFDQSDLLYLDDVSFQQLDDIPIPITVQVPAYSGGAAEAPANGLLALQGRAFEAGIDPRTGLLASLTDRTLRPLSIHSPAPDTTRLFAQSGDREVRFDVPARPPQIRRSPSRQEVRTELLPRDGKLPLRARLTCRMLDDVFEEEAVVQATGEVPQLVRLGLRHGFVHREWERVLLGMKPLRAVEASRFDVFTYGHRPNSLARGQYDLYQDPSLPVTVLERPDRWLLVAERSLDGEVTFAVNEPSGYFPSVQQNPLTVREGDTFRFALTYRSFSKEESLLRDVWRWYGAHVRSDHRLLKGCVPYRPQEVARTVTPGCLVDGAMHYAADSAALNPASLLPRASVWGFGWHDWVNEWYPVTGSWWALAGGWKRLSAAQQREDLRQAQAQGFSYYLYFRNVANLRRVGRDLPAHWVNEQAGGLTQFYEGGFSFPLPDHIAAEVGYPMVPWGSYDFDNDECRQGYVAQVKACLDTYRPAGIAWDLTWSPSEPGILAVQAKLYRWLQRHHPAMRVIANESYGNPTQWFADGILLENGFLCGKSWWDYEVAKAFGSHLYTIERGHLCQLLAERILAGQYAWELPTAFADARRFAEWAIRQGLPSEDQQKANELGARLLLRYGLRDLGLGSSWAYADHLRLYFTKPVPDPLVGFLTEIPTLPLITQSFGIRLNGKADREGDLFAGGWCGQQSLRLAVFNDTEEPRAIEVAVTQEVLRRHGWKSSGRPRTRAFLLDTTGRLAEAPVRAEPFTGGLRFRLPGNLPPFTLLACCAEPR
jgi:hypothetical protein